jgi:hypothetical protein
MIYNKSIDIHTSALAFSCFFRSKNAGSKEKLEKCSDLTVEKLFTKLDREAFPILSHKMLLYLLQTED